MRPLLAAFGTVVITACAAQPPAPSPAATQASPEPAGRAPFSSTYEAPAGPATLIRNATVLTGTGERIEGGDVLLENGVVKALGRALESPAGGAYQQQVVVAIGGELDGAAFRAAWQAVLDHHPALRTAFATERLEELQQTVWQGVEVPLAEEDWSGLEPARREAALAELLARDRERGYDVATPPLLRLRLLRFAAAEHRLLFSFHHLILDGWSLPLLIDDLVAAYRRLAAGERPELAPRQPFRSPWFTASRRQCLCRLLRPAGPPNPRPRARTASHDGRCSLPCPALSGCRSRSCGSGCLV